MRSASGTATTSSDHLTWTKRGRSRQLEEVLALEYFSIATPNPQITSERLALRELMKIARRVVSEAGDQVEVNHKRSRRRRGAARASKAHHAPPETSSGKS